MKPFVIGSVALLGLAACNPGSNGYQATAPARSAPVTSSFQSNPPDNPTGSQAYQSPDLDRRHPLPGQR